MNTMFPVWDYGSILFICNNVPPNNFEILFWVVLFHKSWYFTGRYSLLIISQPLHKSEKGPGLLSSRASIQPRRECAAKRSKHVFLDLLSPANVSPLPFRSFDEFELSLGWVWVEFGRPWKNHETSPVLSAVQSTFWSQSWFYLSCVNHYQRPTNLSHTQSALSKENKGHDIMFSSQLSLPCHCQSITAR